MNERQRILNRIDQLELERCPKCHKHNYNAIDTHCQCPAAVEIRNLGDQLLTHRSSRRSEPETDCRHLIKRFNENMTVDVYRQLRENNYSIMRIADSRKTKRKQTAGRRTRKTEARARRSSGGTQGSCLHQAG